MTADQLDDLPWVPADRAWVTDLTRALTEVTVRKATETDRAAIAGVIAYAYRREFSTVTRDLDKVARALAHAVQIDRFFVAERAGDIVGTIACTDCTGRAMHINTAELWRHLGLVRGTVTARSVVPEFMAHLDYPPSNRLHRVRRRCRKGTPTGHRDETRRGCDRTSAVHRVHARSHRRQHRRRVTATARSGSPTSHARRKSSGGSRDSANGSTCATWASRLASRRGTPSSRDCR